MADASQDGSLQTVTPYLTVPSVPQLIEFLRATFGAETTEAPMKTPDGRVMHAEVRIGNSVVMMGEPPADRPPMPAMLYVMVPDVDATYRRALAAGGTSLREPTDEFYGHRSGGVTDTFGNQWWMAAHIEDVSREEMDRRLAALKK
jgi:PhnB protein